MARTSKEKETVPVEEAARRLGINGDNLRRKMRYCCLHGITFPLGFALPPDTSNGEWTFCIPRRRFEAYMSGDDFSRPNEYKKRFDLV